MCFSFHIYRICTCLDLEGMINLCINQFVYFHKQISLKVSFHKQISLQVSFHVCTPCFTHSSYLRGKRSGRSLLQVSFHICRSLFIYLYVSLPTCMSLVTYVSYLRSKRSVRSLLKVSFHICRSLFTYLYVSLPMYVSCHICVVPAQRSLESECTTHFHISLHIQVSFIGLFPYICISFFTYLSYLRSAPSSRSTFQVQASLLIPHLNLTKTLLEPSGCRRTRQPERTWLLGPGACSGTNPKYPICSD